MKGEKRNAGKSLVEKTEENQTRKLLESLNTVKILRRTGKSKALLNR